MSVVDDYEIEEALSGRSLFDRDPGAGGVPVPPPICFRWNEGQVAAVREISRWRHDPRGPRYLKLTGAAGTGKTAVMGELRRVLSGSRTAWCGMTGKAAQRLREALSARTSTFHSALYHPPREVDNVEESRIDLAFDDVKSGDPGDSLLVVDEASMISPRLREDADEAPYAKVLLVGDWVQIPPVLSRAEEGALGTDDYSVFSGVPGPHLTEVMRNRGAVLDAATLVRETGEIPRESTERGGSRYDYVPVGTPDEAVRAAVEAYLADPEDHALITWRNDSRTSVNRIVRLRLGHRGDLPDRGEPLVVRRNAHRLGLMNGDVVRCVEVGEEGPTLAGVPTRWLWVRGDLGKDPVKVLVPAGDFSGTLPYVGLATWKKALEEASVREVVPMTFGYCLTAHLAQGSTYRRATTFLPGDIHHPHFCKMTALPDGSRMPFSMRFIYTAVSRSRAHSMLIVSR